MFRILSLSVLLLWSVQIWAQQTPIEVPLNSSTVFKDELGKVISFNDFLAQTSGNDYEMNPVFDEQNELKEVIIVKSSIAHARNQMTPTQFANTVELIDQIPPDFAGVDLQGNTYDADNLSGKVVVLKFWFKACPPCVDEIPALNQLVAAYRDNPEVVFLAPSLDKKATIQSFLQKIPFDYAIIPDARKIAHNYNVPGYPTHVVINRFGKVKTVYLGVNHRIKDKLTNAIEYALQQTSPDPEMQITNTPVPPEEEIFITPNSIIKNEAGEILPFGQFVDLMNNGEFQLLPRKDNTGESYILMKPISSKNQSSNISAE